MYSKNMIYEQKSKIICFINVKKYMIILNNKTTNILF